MRRWAAEASPLLQGTAAATAAWVIAKQVGDHPDPFFAPIAAVIALNTALGERGLNTLRLLLGVVVGIVAGELAVAGLGGGWGTLALATFAAMAVASALHGERIVIAQAAAGAILTVAVADGEAGFERLLDALIGAGVALVFSQLLFSPEPLKLLRRAEAAALAEMAGGLRLTAQSLDRDDDELGDQAMTKLRTVRDELADLGRTRDASSQVARHSPVWRSQMAPVVEENENAGHLDLLGGSCLTLARTALGTAAADHRKVAPSVHELAAALADLASDPGDRETRQGAADRALDVARQLAPIALEPGSPLADAFTAVRLVTVDVMVFAGVSPEHAEAVVGEGTGQFEVPAPPAPRAPFRRGRRRPGR